MNRLTRFENHPQYETFKGTDHYTKANVSICTTEYHIHYDGINYKNEYLTITALGDGYLRCFSQEGTIWYSLDNGKTWTEFINGNTPQELDKVPLTKGQKILLKGNLNEAVTSTNHSITVRMAISEDEDIIDENFTNIDFNVSGNLLSIGYGDDFVGKEKFTNTTVAFASMFSYSNVVSAKNLILPQPTSGYMYAGMFGNCTKLVETPKLPHMSLTPGCYIDMFRECTSLTTGPKLPATTLTSDCYSGMFSGCTSLTTAPVLPAKTLADHCYDSMFMNCENLSYINAQFISYPDNYRMSVNNWVYGVSSNGTFVMNGNAEWRYNTNKFIPSGWTIIEYPPRTSHENFE